MLKIAQKIKNGECPVLCFFGDSITDGQFEFANGHKESVRHEEWVFWNILRNRIREEIGQEVSIVNAGVGGNFSKDGLARIQQDVLERKPDFCCVMFGSGVLNCTVLFCYKNMRTNEIEPREGLILV